MVDKPEILDVRFYLVRYSKPHGQKKLSIVKTTQRRNNVKRTQDTRVFGVLFQPGS